MAHLTTRMVNWLEALGAHIGTATKNGFPTAIVVEKAKVEGSSTVIFPLTAAQISHIKSNITENPYVSVGPGGLGCVRAPYQLKGNARIEGEKLMVEVKEIYCTKPGPEAGKRLDVLSPTEIEEFDQSRWKDLTPPGE
ncbi:MAG: hypothetical protein K8I29_04225 [Alphaproteobacteria bacterium]|uniref:Pyridoxamine 5'-phosphate oxidase putative domain-containing protein n=1 Tax=Candidatus Nitrobium versatile TaxID=2884831 RepID=A0A953J8U3_9BACT|nr:hypothetical protein [Candidatus Nitrobium versatile]